MEQCGHGAARFAIFLHGFAATTRRTRVEPTSFGGRDRPFAKTRLKILRRSCPLRLLLLLLRVIIVDVYRWRSRGEAERDNSSRRHQSAIFFRPRWRETDPWSRIRDPLLDYIIERIFNFYLSFSLRRDNRSSLFYLFYFKLDVSCVDREYSKSFTESRNATMRQGWRQGAPMTGVQRRDVKGGGTILLALHRVDSIRVILGRWNRVEGSLTPDACGKLSWIRAFHIYIYTCSLCSNSGNFGKDNKEGC